MPAIRLPRGVRGPFDYRVPDAFAGAVARGSVVRVPWRSRETDAIVLRIHDRTDAPPEKLKDIAGLGSTERIGEDLLGLLEWTSRHYFVPLGTVLKAVIPQTPKRKVLRELPEPSTSAATRPMNPGRSHGKVIRYRCAEEKFRLVRSEAARSLSSGKGCLVIVPHAADIGPMVTALDQAVPDASAVPYHGALNAGDAWAAWQKLASGTARLAVGTRQCAYAPVRDLGSIIVTESDSPDLKQYDQNPRFDARETAVRRGLLCDAEVLLMSHAPRIEDRARTDAPGWTLEPAPPHEPDTTLVGVAGALGRHDTGPLPPSVTSAVADALRKREKVLIFLNRRGESSALVCGDCGRVFRCPTCRIARTVHAASLHCHRCGGEEPMPLTCPDCGGASLRRLGIGTSSLERHLRETFPDATISRKDAEQREGRDTDIVIGTTLAVHDIAELGEHGPFALVICADTDGLLAHGGFRTTEDAWRTVRTLKDAAAEGNGRLLLLSVDPDGPGIRELLATSEEFARKETEARRVTGYPPAATLIAVIAFGDTEADARAAAQCLITELRPRVGDATTVHGPLRPATPFRHGRWRALVVVRARMLDEALMDYLTRLPEGYVIDRDPEYLS